MREGICGNINKALREGIVCRQEIETNRLSDYCTLTMVRFEDNNLLHALLLQSELYFRISCFEWRNRVYHVTAFAANYLEDTDDEVRFGVMEDRMRMSLSDTG